ncbi:MAG: zinc ABC transporter substrate-binding protein, partial [Parachlamydiales bacterium]
MQKFFYLLFASLFLLAGCSGEKKPSVKPKKPLVLVSIPPYLFFVQKIAGETLEVKNLIPAGADPHNFEPTPKHLTSATRALIWFRSEEPFEKTFLELLRPYNQKLIECNLNEKIALINHDGHLWLSPKIALIQAKKITDMLASAFPENQNLYEDNFQNLKTEIEKTDREIRTKLDLA